MIAIGIDPGTATSGYGIVSLQDDTFSLIEYGTIETDKNLPDSKRLYILSEKISSLIKKHSPSFLAIENVYFFKNLKTALPVSQAKGVIMLTAEKAKIPVYEFTPLEVKITITGYGKADKNQMQEMIRLTLNLDEIPKPNDAADALGAAICGILRNNSPF